MNLANRHISMISEGSRDWINNAENAEKNV